MKILSPVDHPDEVASLVEAGADELFCGLTSDRWLSRYTIAAVSRRSARIANLESLDLLGKTVALAHERGVPVCLAVNEHYYTQAQQAWLLEHVGDALALGIDALIIADPALLLTLRKAGVRSELHLSTGTTILNSEAARFFADLGVSRVTLERQQTVGEIEALVRKTPGLETAVFVLNGRCPNIDGLCTFDHTQLPGEAFKNACMVPCRVRCHAAGSPSDPDDRCGAEDGAEAVQPSTGAGASAVSVADEAARVAPVVRQQVWQRHHMDDSPCGACALHDFDRIGVTHLKIVGRGNTTRRKIADLRFIRSLVTLASSSGVSRKRFRESARLLHSHLTQRPCRAVHCYYPELLPRSARRA